MAAAAKEVVEAWRNSVKREQAAEQAAADLRRTTSGATRRFWKSPLVCLASASMGTALHKCVTAHTTLVL